MTDSGFDTKTRKPKVMKFKVGTRSKFAEYFRGQEDDAWALLVDVAIGARASGQSQSLQRHEGRVWASTVAGALESAAAKDILLAELKKLLPQSLP